MLGVISKQAKRLINGHWFAKIPPLPPLDAQISQEVAVGFGFDTFTDDADTARRAQIDHGFQEILIFLILQGFAHIDPVDLDHIHIQIAQILQPRCTCTKIIKRHFMAKVPNAR